MKINKCLNCYKELTSQDGDWLLSPDRGNVSLGTTNPSFKLKVNNSAATWQLIKQLRLLIMTWILQLALIVCPKSAIRTLLWFSEIPKDY